MGMIYLAHDPAIDRKVAIKLIRADLLGGDERADEEVGLPAVERQERLEDLVDHDRFSPPELLAAEPAGRPPKGRCRR